mmetsp:Transcript_89767/g.238489  ORF Transcript_89767/g.238489 Transcript_89767/m.238489 type:complete len:231 (-) Transcript_89767:69-761(-)
MGALQCCSGVADSLRRLREQVRDAGTRLTLLRNDCNPHWLGSRSYWEAAYATGRYEERYEWLQSCGEIWPHLEQQLPAQRASCKLLHVGCGNSGLGRRLHDAGWIDVTNVDYSASVIALMQRREPELRWLCLDCSEPGALGAEVYDACVEKGALDSLFEAGSSAALETGRRMVLEVHRSLKPGGRYVVFSNQGSPMKALEEQFAEVSCEITEGYSCDLFQKILCVIVCQK